MALYDIIDEIAAKKVTKTDTGDSLINGVVIGIVAKNYDKDMPGRVCVTIPTRDKDANELQWARMIQPSDGKEWGHYFIPEVGDQVAIIFEGGNIERPYILGCVARDNDKFLGAAIDENNQIKRIGTRNGNSITFFDHKDGDGDKDKLTLQTAGREHSIVLDNEGKQMVVTDKAKKNSIAIKTEDGNMTIKADSRLTIQVGSVKITINGESGSVKIDANELSVKTSNRCQVKCDGMVKTEGAQVMSKASSMSKLECSGMVSIAGNLIKIG